MDVFDPPPVEGLGLGEPPQAGYASIDSLEPATAGPDDDWQLRLDVIDAASWETRQGDGGVVALRQSLRTYVLEAEAAYTDGALDAIVSAGRQMAEGEEGPRRWWRLRFEQKTTRPRVQLFANVFEDPFRLRVVPEEVVELDREFSDDLNAACEAPNLPLATEDAIRNALLGIERQTRYLAVLDVGQGSANALLDGVGHPVAFFDVGGGVTTNRRTWPKDFPDGVPLCAPLVILSHWDLDHYAAHRNVAMSAEELDARYADTIWIVPQNPQGDPPTASHMKFLDRLLSAGATVLLWPNGLDHVDTGDMLLMKCRGPNRNDAGLALALRPSNEWIAALLTGDAAPRYLPYRLGEVLSYPAFYVAPHHGAHVGDDPFMPPDGEAWYWTREYWDYHYPSSGRPWIVISFGARNTFGHPHYRSLRGWRWLRWWATAERQPTPGGERNGHVMLDLLGSGNPPPQPEESEEAVFSYAEDRFLFW